MPYPYILHVFSRPFAVSEEIWKQWYVEEHMPDMVYFGVSRTGAVYRKIQSKLPVTDASDKNYLAIYQSTLAKQLDVDDYKSGKKVRHGSTLWPGLGGAKSVGNFDIRNYKLLKEYNASGLEDDAAKFILHLEIDPQDEGQLDEWIRTDHIKTVSSQAGYRRSLYYGAGIMEDGSPGVNVARFVLMHEFDTIDGIDEFILETYGTREVKETARIFNVRVFQILSSSGYRGTPIHPKRLDQPVN